MVFVLLPSMSRYTSLDKLRRAIWCEIYVIREGYIPYLKKWTELQESSNIKAKDNSQEDEVHSDTQRLFPGGPKKVSDSQKLANSDDTK